MDLEELEIPKNFYKTFCKDYRTYLEKLESNSGRTDLPPVMDWCIKYCEIKGELLMRTFIRSQFNPNLMYALCSVEGNMDFLCKKLKVHPSQIFNYFEK